MNDKIARRDKRRNDNNFHQRNSADSVSQESECVITGRNAVRELLASERSVDKIFVSDGDREGSVKLLVAIAIERKIPVIEVSKTRLDAIAPGIRHQGIIAIVPEHEYSSVDDILEYAKERGEKPFVIILDGVEDPHNLGAIIRSAECLGAHGVIIPKRRAVGITPTVAKSSAGAIEYVRVAKVTNIAATVDELKEKGLWIYAADMGGDDYTKTDLTGNIAVVLGNEGFGISRLVKEKCDFTISIPLHGKVNSMNVSCAAAAIFAEVARQRNS